MRFACLIVVATTILAVAGLPCALAAQSQPSSTDADAAAIKHVFTDFYENFSRHDAHAAAICFAEDADFTNMGGVHSQGRKEIENRLARLFQGILKDATRTDIVRSIRFFSPEIAAVDADTTITGTKAPDGSVIPPRKGLMIVTMTKQNSHWLISTFHEAEFPEPRSQGAKASASDVPVYLPPSEADGVPMPLFLYALGEPSLFEAAKDPNVVAYRASYVVFPTGRQVAVRLVVSADGTGKITTAIDPHNLSVVERTAGSVSAADVKKFLALIEKAGFWSMSSIEQQNDKVGRKTITLDGSWWMLEGVSAGSFHYVYRPNPGPGPTTEVGRYLVDDLPKLAAPLSPNP